MSNPRISSNTFVAITQLRSQSDQLIQEMKQHDSNRIAEFEQRYQFIKQELNKRIANQNAGLILDDFEKRYKQQKFAIESMVNEQQKKGEEMHAALSRKQSRPAMPESFMQGDAAVRRRPSRMGAQNVFTTREPVRRNPPQQAEVEPEVTVEIPKQPAEVTDAEIKQAIDKDASKRTHILKEMMSTELKYLQDVKVVANDLSKFRADFNQKMFDVKFMMKQNPAVRSSVEDFMNGFVELNKSSTEMYSLLDQNKNNKDFSINIDVLSAYLKNDNYWETIQDTALNINKFNKEARSGEYESYDPGLNAKFMDSMPDGKNTMQAFMTTPVQRGPRWVLLLQDLVNNTSELDPEYAKKRDLLNFVKTKVATINELERKQAMEPMIAAITSQLESLAHNKKDPDLKHAIATINYNIKNVPAMKLDKPQDYMIEIQKELNKIRVNARSTNIGGEFLSRHPSTAKILTNIDKAIGKSDYYESFDSRQIVAIQKMQGDDLLQKKNDKKNPVAMNLNNLAAVYENAEKWRILEEVAKARLGDENTNFYSAYMKVMMKPSITALNKLKEDFIDKDSKQPINISDKMRTELEKNIKEANRQFKVTPEVSQSLKAVAAHIEKTLREDHNWQKAFTDAQKPTEPAAKKKTAPTMRK